MKHLLAWILAFLTCGALAQEAGKVDFTEGGVRLYDSNRQERAVAVGTAVNEGDTIETAADGEVHLAMADGGQLALRPNTRMRIQSYKADGGKDDRSVLSLLTGAMRSITGWIGKYNARNYEIRTPTATIGVRGTDHETLVIPEGSDDGEAGTYDKVNSGATRMTTRFGSTDIRPNQAGFMAAAGRARPRLLDRMPAFFRSTRNEHRLEGLHERIRERIDQRREQRLREVTERRQEFRKDFGERKSRALEQRREIQERRRERSEMRRDSGLRPTDGKGWRERHADDGGPRARQPKRGEFEGRAQHHRPNPR